MQLFILYLFIINFFSFIIMFIDKTLAKLNKYRISEKFLFSCAFLLGALGIYIGMFVFRHKTKHSSFKFGIPIIFFLNLLCVYLIYINFYI